MSLTVDYGTQKVIERLNDLGYNNVRTLGRSKLAVFTDNASLDYRRDFIQELASKIDGSVYEKSPRSDSSAGRLLVDNGAVSILVKPDINGSAAGISNEYVLFSTINSYLFNHSTPMNITFVDDRGRTFEVRDCVSVIRASKRATQLRKADLHLVDVNNRKYPISVKCDSSHFWASLDTYFSDEAASLIDEYCIKRGIIGIEKNDDGIYRLEKNIAIDVSESEKKMTIFGDDILPNGCVICRNFGASDFSFSSPDQLTIKASNVVQSVSDVRGSDMDVCFLIHNNMNRRGIAAYPGIRPQAVWKSRAKSAVFVERLV